MIQVYQRSAGSFNPGREDCLAADEGTHQDVRGWKRIRQAGQPAEMALCFAQGGDQRGRSADRGGKGLGMSAQYPFVVRKTRPGEVVEKSSGSIEAKFVNKKVYCCRFISKVQIRQTVICTLNNLWHRRGPSTSSGQALHG